MKEHQVDGKVLVADLDQIFRSHKAEVPAQLVDESDQIPEKRAVEVRFGVVLCESEELQAVGPFELVGCRRADLCRLRRHLLRRRQASEGGTSADLSFQLPLGPASLDRSEQVELAFFRILRATEEDQVMGPRQLSRH